MRVLFEINHPAQAHFFKHLIWMLQKNGHQVLAATRDKDVTLKLLDAIGIEYVCISKKGRGITGLAGELVLRYGRLLKLARRFRPDAMMALTGVSIGPVGAVLGVPRLVLEEAEHARLQQWLALPFATKIFTGTGYEKNWGPRQVHFKGVWVQSYLHPAYFTPDPRPLREAGVDPSQRIILMRTVSWGAAHDVGIRGLSLAQTVGIAQRLSRYGRVIISSEGEPPAELAPWRNPLPVHHMHHLLAHCALYLGDGTTVNAEAAVMGVPNVCFCPLRCGYIHMLAERFGLVELAGTPEQAVDIAERLLSDANLAQVMQPRLEKLMAETEDVNLFMYKLIEDTVRQWQRRA